MRQPWGDNRHPSLDPFGPCCLQKTPGSEDLTRSTTIQNPNSTQLYACFPVAEADCPVRDSQSVHYRRTGHANAAWAYEVAAELVVPAAVRKPNSTRMFPRHRDRFPQKVQHSAFPRSRACRRGLGVRGDRRSGMFPCLR